jgi:NADH:ubiquinone oxidoreductase subunit K
MPAGKHKDWRTTVGNVLDFFIISIVGVVIVGLAILIYWIFFLEGGKGKYPNIEKIRGNVEIPAPVWASVPNRTPPAG